MSTDRPDITPLSNIGNPKRRDRRDEATGTRSAESSGSSGPSQRTTPRLTPDDLPASDRLNVSIDREKVALAKQILNEQTFAGVVYTALGRLYEDLRDRGYDI